MFELVFQKIILSEKGRKKKNDRKLIYSCFVTIKLAIVLYLHKILHEILKNCKAILIVSFIVMRHSILSSSAYTG